MRTGLLKKCHYPYEVAPARIEVVGLYPTSRWMHFVVPHALAEVSKRRKAAIGISITANHLLAAKRPHSTKPVRRKLLRIRRASGFDPHRPYQLSHLLRIGWQFCEAA